MRNLLSANFMRLWKEKVFWILFSWMLVLGALFPALKKINEIKTNIIETPDSAFGQFAILIGIVMAIFCSFFVGQEYSDGTIRNKIVVGKKRIDIYLSNFIVCVFVSLLMGCVFFFTYFIVGIPLLGGLTFEPKIVFQLIMTVFFLSVAFSSVYTMIAMICSSKSITAILSILLAFLFLLSGLYLNKMLNEPETILGMRMEAGEPVYEESKNPSFLEEDERKVFQFLYDANLGGQMIQCATLDSIHLSILPVYSLVFTFGTVIIGLRVFQKKKIN